jgi:hypothetical protein
VHGIFDQKAVEQYFMSGILEAEECLLFSDGEKKIWTNNAFFVTF